jgi:hypothetical protein
MGLNVVKYADLVSRMARDIPNFDYQDALHALQDAGREFCNLTEAWFENLASINIVADQHTYTLATDYPARFKRVKSIHILSSTDVTNGKEGQLMDATYYKLVLPSTLKFAVNHTPATAVTGGLVVEVVFVPDMGSTELPAWLMSRWGDGIIGKAMYELLKVKDVNKAALFLTQYHAKLNEAMVESMDEITPYVGSSDVRVQEYTP